MFSHASCVLWLDDLCEVPYFFHAMRWIQKRKSKRKQMMKMVVTAAIQRVPAQQIEMTTTDDVCLYSGDK